MTHPEVFKIGNLENVTDEIVSLLGVMREKFLRPAEQNTRSHLSHTQFNAVLILQQKGFLPMTELAAELKISKQQLTPIIAKLIKNGLVVRKADGNDRRIIYIEITDSGRIMHDQIMANIRRGITGKLKALPEGELTELQPLLARMHEIIKKIE